MCGHVVSVSQLKPSSTFKVTLLESKKRMPAYHSKMSEEGASMVCSCATLSLKTEVRGPAAPHPAGSDDIVDETLAFFRANVLFRNFDVRGGADRTLIYLTMFTVLCLVKCEKIEDKPSALRELKQMAIKKFLIPGDAGWPLGGLYPLPETAAEGELFRAYFKQAREELTVRLCERLFDADGSKNKWWQSYSKRKFMGKELKE